MKADRNPALLADLRRVEEVRIIEAAGGNDRVKQPGIC